MIVHWFNGVSLFVTIFMVHVFILVIIFRQLSCLFIVFPDFPLCLKRHFSSSSSPSRHKSNHIARSKAAEESTCSNLCPGFGIGELHPTNPLVVVVVVLQRTFITKHIHTSMCQNVPFCHHVS